MKKCSYILTAILVFSLMISCESTVQQSEVEDNQNHLVEKAKAYLLSTISASEAEFQQIVEKEGFKVPAFRVESKPNTLYMVFINKDGTPKRLLIQQHEMLGEDKVKYLHYLGSQEDASRHLVGTMTVNRRGELLNYSIENDFHNLQKTARSSMPCMEDGEKIPCGSGDETCTGYHYRKMMKAIESNGDTKALCDVIGGICIAQVYIAAYVHCKKSH